MFIATYDTVVQLGGGQVFVQRMSSIAWIAGNDAVVDKIRKRSKGRIIGSKNLRTNVQ